MGMISFGIQFAMNGVYGALIPITILTAIACVFFWVTARNVRIILDAPSGTFELVTVTLRGVARLRFDLAEIDKVQVASTQPARANAVHRTRRRVRLELVISKGENEGRYPLIEPMTGAGQCQYAAKYINGWLEEHRKAQKKPRKKKS